MATIVPGVKRLIDFVSLVDGINCFLDIPETIVLLVYGERGDGKDNILLNRHIVPDSSELALEADTCWIVGA
jgi:hypothetical protein